MKKWTVILFVLTEIQVGLSQKMLWNLDFENWTDSTLVPNQSAFDEVGFEIENPYLGIPESWTGAHIHRTTDAVAGNYAAVISRWYNYADGRMSLGECGIEHHQCRLKIETKISKISGYYKYYITDGDTLMHGRAQMSLVVSGTVNGVYMDTIGLAAVQFLQEENEYRYFESVIQYVDVLAEVDSFSLTFHSLGDIPSALPLHNFLFLDNITIELASSGANINTNSAQITLFPNPATEKFTIKSEINHADHEDISLIDTYGTVVKEGLRINENIDIGLLKQGCYFVKVSDVKFLTRLIPLIIH
jgi:hypothetical protein